MASFTDTQMPKFNPYIQQQPVEAMVAVGTQKQKAYEEGVQKIQTQVDNIAGLDVVRVVDKAYLQSKLNELGSRLKSVAGGDFSNFQLVNSVGGMTKQLIRDDGIQNAVNSTAKYRKEIASMEAAEKEGKSSPANRYVFGADSSAWLNSTDVNTSFNTKYQPYVDVKKRWMETMKSLHSDLTEQDIPYERNNDGSINYGKTAAAMQRKSKETVSADKIANALSASLTPEELNQLNIDGRYTFRGQTPASLAAMSESKYASTVASNNERMKELEGLISLSASDPVLQKKAKDSLESLKLQNTALKGNHESELQTIANNPEFAKGLLYKNGAVEQFAIANAWEHNKSNLLSNPVLEADHWEKNYSLDKSKFALSVRSQNFDEWKSKKDIDIKEREYNLKVAKQQAELYGLSGEFEDYGGASTLVKDPMTAMVNKANDHDQAVHDGIVQLVKAMPGTSSVQIKQALDKYQKGDPNWFKMGKDSRTIIPVTLREVADDIIENRKQGTLIKTGIKQSIDEVDSSAEIKRANSEILTSVKDLSPVVVTDAQGRKVTFSQKEVVDYYRKIKKSPGMVGPGTFVAPSLEFTKALTNKEKLLTGNIPQESKKLLREYGSRTLSKIKDTNEMRDERIESSLLKKGSTFIPRQTSITFGSDAGNIARRRLEGLVNTSLAPYGSILNESGAVGGTDKLSQGDYNIAKEWISGDDKDKIVYSKVEQGDKTFVQMTLKGKDVLVPISQLNSYKIPSGDTRSPSPQYKKVVSAQMIGNGSTNPTGKFEDSMFDNTNIKGTRLNIGADLIWNESNHDKQYVSLKLNTPIGYMPLMYETPVDRDQAIKIIEGLTDKEIKELYLKDPNIPQKWKSIIEKL